MRGGRSMSSCAGDDESSDGQGPGVAIKGICPAAD